LNSLEMHSQMRIDIKAGLDIPLGGAPEQVLSEHKQVRHVALLGTDYHGLKPRLQVELGDQVTAGQSLFTDRHDPEVAYTSPGSGTVDAIHLGPRRTLAAVIVRLNEEAGPSAGFEPIPHDRIDNISREWIAGQLARSGLWTAFRTRPFSRVPRSDAVPQGIFVTALDTDPLGADPQVAIGRAEHDFRLGLTVIERLTPGSVWLCTGPQWNFAAPTGPRLRHVVFAGPHPAGLPGTHIHHLQPVSRRHHVWHIGYQDVIAIGSLFARGELCHDRVIALGGSPLKRPRLVLGRVGANVDELLEGELQSPGACRTVSGSLLSGHAATGFGLFLGRYHNQVCAVEEGGRSRLFGWRGGKSGFFSCFGLRSRSATRQSRFDTSVHGRRSGVLPLRKFERVLPLDVLPAPLFRAMLTGDTVAAEALGCLEFDEEDLALCSFLCPAKSDYGRALRDCLDMIGKET
jgi:Na+-transporting NADH:ubiquinone oxidoreductase subunit A